MDKEQQIGETFEFGVLLVHGIGEQCRAETLMHFGEPLIKEVQQQLKPNDKNLSIVDLVTKAQIDGDEPASAEVTFQYDSRDGRKDQTTRWIFAEAWWAEAFPTPTYQQIYDWVTKAIPWTLTAHFDGRLRRVGYNISNNRQQTTSLMELGKLLLKWMEEAFITFLGLLIVPVLLLFLGLFLITALIPIHAVRQFIGKVQRLLSATMGDSFVYLNSPIFNTATVNKVRSDFKWMVSRCRRVAVIAHSQGGALAHAALRETVMRESDLFVTFGSGLRKLNEIERISQYPKASKVVWLVIWGAIISAFGVVNLILLSSQIGISKALALAAFTEFIAFMVGGILIYIALQLGYFQNKKPSLSQQHIDLSFTGSEIAGLIIYLLILLFISFNIVPYFIPHLLVNQTILWVLFISIGLAISYAGLRRWQRLSGRSSDQETQKIIEKNRYEDLFRFRSKVRWIDIFASSDPVSNGPLLDVLKSDEMESYEINNYRSMIRDHTAYWSNADSFVRPLASELISASRLNISRVPSTQHIIDERRYWRIKELVIARWCIGIVFISLFISAVTVEASWIDHVVTWYIKEFGSIDNIKKISFFKVIFGDASLGNYLFNVTKGNHEVELPFYAAVFSSLLVSVEYLIILLPWSRWNKRESELRQPFKRNNWDMVVFFMLLVLIAVSGMLVSPIPLTIVLAIILVIVLLAVGQRFQDSLFGNTQAAEKDQLKDLISKRKKKNINLIGLGWRIFHLEPPDDKKESIATWALDENSAEGLFLVSQYIKIKETDTEEEIKAKNERKRNALEKAADLDYPEAIAELASVCRQEGEKQRAIKLYQSAMNKGLTWCRYSLARLLEETDLVGARQLYKEEMKIRNGRAATHVGYLAQERAKVAENAKKTKSRERFLNVAEARFRRAINYGYSESALELGKLLLAREKIEESRIVFIEGGNLGVPGCYNAWGDIEFSTMGNNQRAQIAYNKEVNRDPNSYAAGNALFKLGLIEEQNKNLVAAKLHYSKSILTKKIDGQAADALGQVLEKIYQSKRSTETRDAIVNAYETAEQQDDDYNKHLFKFYLKINETENAYRQYNRNKEIYYEPSDLEKLATQLKNKKRNNDAKDLYKASFLKGNNRAVFHLIAQDESKDVIYKLFKQRIRKSPESKKYLYSQLRDDGRLEYADFVAKL